ncbi:MAG: hypothetical protein ABW148_09275 [Sedimenticola sp.]
MVYLSRDAIVEERNAADTKLLEIEKNLKLLSEIEIKVSRGNVAKQGLQNAIQNIDAIKVAQQLNAFTFVLELDNLQRRLSELRPIVGGEELPNEVPVWMQELKEPLIDAVASIRQQSEMFAAQKADLENRLTSLRETQSITTSMLVEIRVLAKQLLLHSPDHTDCPVCSTVFEVGELQRRLEQVVSQTSRDQTAPVLDELMVAHERLSLAESKHRILHDLVAYAKRRGLEQLSAFPQYVLLDYQHRRESLGRLQDRHADTTLHISGLATSGLNFESINALRQSASSMGIDVMRQEALDEELARKSDGLTEMDTVLDQHAEDRRSLTSKICMAIRGVEAVTEPIDDIVKAFRNRRTQLHSAFMLINELQQFLTLESDADASSIAPLLDSAKASAERFAKALESESTSRANEVTAKEQLEKIEKRIVDHQAAEKRVQQAIGVLLALEKEDSLIAATDAELVSVQTETDEIFRRIHSPREYGVRRDAKAPLYRLDKPSQAITLREVSTGQRAAFVLSVFLAMNAKLQTAPPVLLFDDPVAHIDDFNSLSFLDHLRDIALEGRRQIFYATADSRLAGLFEHKFSFMGDKFKRFNLVR